MAAVLPETFTVSTLWPFRSMVQVPLTHAVAVQSSNSVTLESKKSPLPFTVSTYRVWPLYTTRAANFVLQYLHTPVVISTDPCSHATTLTLVIALVLFV